MYDRNLLTGKPPISPLDSLKIGHTEAYKRYLIDCQANLQREIQVPEPDVCLHVACYRWEMSLTYWFPGLRTRLVTGSLVKTG